jgi:hypothetical protein
LETVGELLKISLTTLLQLNTTSIKTKSLQSMLVQVIGMIQICFKSVIMEWLPMRKDHILLFGL